MTPASPSHAGVRLHIVTGKGGTGKTTVAAALALALARQGKRVLLAEVEGRQGICQTFDVPPLGTRRPASCTTRDGGEVCGLSVDAKAALMEYLQMFYKLGRAGACSRSSGPSTSPRRSPPACATSCSSARSTRRPPARGRQGRHHDRPHRPTTRWCSTRRRRAASSGSSTSTPRWPTWPRWARSAPRPTRSPAMLRQPHDGGARGHPARGDAGAGDGRRHRRARRGRRSRWAPSSSTRCRDRCWRTGQLASAVDDPDRRGRRRHRRPRGGLGAHRRRHGGRAARAGRRPRRPGGPRAGPGGDPARARAGRSTACRCSPEGIDAGGDPRAGRPAHRAGDGLMARRPRHQAAHRRHPTRTTLDLDALLADPATEHRRLLRLRRRRQDDHGRRPRPARRPSRAAGSSSSPSTRPAGWPSRSASPSSTTPPARSRGIDTAGGRDARRDDARHEADLRRGRRGALDAGEGRADPRQPLLPGGLQLLRRHAGVHGDGEARPAAQPGRPAERHRGTSSSSTPRRRGRRWTSSTRPSGSARSSTAASSGCSSAPAKAGGRAGLKVFSPACNVVTTVLSKVLGGQMLQRRADVRRRRWTRCSAASASAPTRPMPCSRTAATAFLVVAAPERDALREASYFVDRLDEEGMPLAGLVVNRIQRVAAPALSGLAGAGRRRAAGRRADARSDDRRPLTAGLLRPARRPGADAPTGSSGWRGASPRATPAYPVVEVPGRGPGHPRPRGPAGGRQRARGRLSRRTLGVRSARRGRGPACEQGAPGRDVGVALEQGAALALGHPTPHAELGAVVEGVGEALGDDGAALADDLGVCWAAPWTNSASGSDCAQRPSAGAQSSHPAGPTAHQDAAVAPARWSLSPPLDTAVRPPHCRRAYVRLARLNDRNRHSVRRHGPCRVVLPLAERTSHT